MPKVLFLIAKKNFRDEEYLKPREIFKNSGIEVVTCSSIEGECSGMLGAKAVAELSVEKALQKTGEFDALVIAGGSGAAEFLENEDVMKLVRNFFESNKPVAAICISPSILAKAGILKGKKATVWSSAFDKSFIKYLEEGGAKYQKKKVVVDGKIVTASGPDAAEEFGKKIVELLK